MSHAGNYAVKYWRGIALLLLFAASFYFTWGNLLFWMGLAILTFSDPSARADLQKPVSTGMILYGLCVPTFFLTYASIHIFENPVLPVLAVFTAMGSIAGLIIWRDKRRTESGRSLQK